MKKNVENYVGLRYFREAKKKNILKDSVTYLSGAIDCADDKGHTWRDKITPKLGAFGIKVINPLKKPGDNTNVSEQDAIKVHKQNNSWDEVTKIVKGFRRLDLRYVDLADSVIVYINTDIFILGTTNEILVAEEQHKPIFAIIEGGKEKAPSWLFAMLDWRTEMFDDMESCLDYIGKLNSGEVKLNDKWVLIRNYL